MLSEDARVALFKLSRETDSDKFSKNEALEAGRADDFAAGSPLVDDKARHGSTSKPGGYTKHSADKFSKNKAFEASEAVEEGDVDSSVAGEDEQDSIPLESLLAAYLESVSP